MIGELLCNANKSLLEAMKVINHNAKGACFAIDDSNKLLGIVTDGDIRRALLSDIELSEKIHKIISKNFVYGKVDEDYSRLSSKLSNKISIIPIVDENFEVVDFFEFKQTSHYPVAIPNLNGNEFKYLSDAFLSSWISSKGKYIDAFESKFSSFSDCEFGVSVSNGTVALHLALISLGIGKGDEVIIPNLTFAATINAVLHCGAKPVIVDIEEESWTIDPKLIEQSLSPNTKAIIVVHLYGQPCDMDSIMKISNKYNIKIIEDCAEAHGAKYSGRKVGSFGDIGCFSFYGNKVITTGEGGMCTTNNEMLYHKMRKLRDHGMSSERRYWHDIVGYNYRLTNLQASIGLAQLERIDEILKNRKNYEEAYYSKLQNIFIFQTNLKYRNRITWLVSVLVNKNMNRDEIINNLSELGIDARPFFYPLNEMEIYKKFSKNPTPVSQKISYRGLNLPTYESLKSIEDIIKILDLLNTKFSS